MSLRIVSLLKPISTCKQEKQLYTIKPKLSEYQILIFAIQIPKFNEYSN